MRGDFVLYQSKPGSIADWLVARFTYGPYVHAAVDMGDGTFVAELTQSGLTRHPANGKDRSLVFVHPRGNLEVGLAWVEDQLAAAGKDPERTESHEYGWVDIVVDAAKVLGFKLILRRETEWDCSDFVTRYLVAAGAAGPLGKAARDPQTVSPNDLARAFGVLRG